MKEDELRVECIKLERDKQDFEDQMISLERKEVEYEEDILQAQNKVGIMEADCQDDSQLMSLMGEKRSILNKIRNSGEELQRTLRKEREKGIEGFEEKITALKEELQ